ncbi:YwdI family protein [Evansella cellulosilytica]|uniref:YwdI family protein n=1 Tax=Evansella cellulosilytica (strain ATCC 21833 / DSM 2522 / FERM P-1141 / JCM 9156 / N-4) TaxID=649639 RepID=E6TY51_EVAC2|nr:YwdI family protein [Evansella cellulosilytica]ADU32370.1 hypothetical protein Bcell_4143 [Evansella cellulosilytica DSM 2522]
MEIPAKVVVQKMEEELAKLKTLLEGDSSSPAFRDQATAIKTYCDLLLSSHETKRQAAPKVNHASVDDVINTKSTSETIRTSSGEKVSIYDDGDIPKSDSLLDF